MIDLDALALPIHPTLCHPHTGEPLRAVGVGKTGRPWWPVMGASDDDDDDKDESDEDDDAEDDDDKDESKKGDKKDDDADEFKPPTKAEWDKIQRQLKRANTQAAKLRTAKGKGDESDEDKEAATKAAQAEVIQPAIKAAARGLLTGMGLKGKPDRVLRMLDFEDLTIDKDGDVDGLQDQLDDIKDEYPDLFGVQSKRRRNGGGSDNDSNNSGKGGKSNDQRLEDAVMGRR